jgi:hypothetical protein
MLRCVSVIFESAAGQLPANGVGSAQEFDDAICLNYNGYGVMREIGVPA